MNRNFSNFTEKGMIEDKVSSQKQEHWTEVIAPESGLLDLQLANIWRYRDLLIMFVRRDFIAAYKQTVLGPLWFFLQPILTALTYIIIFGFIAGLSTDGLPKMLFYLAGVTCWNYFSECLNKTATVFKDNATIFGKVYFPRLIMPLSIIASNLVKFAIQFVLFLSFLFYYLIDSNHNLHPNINILLTPVLIIIMAGLGLGFGIIISALTSKYRDLFFLLSFGVQLLMFVAPVILPLSSVPEKFRIIMQVNPMTSILETFRYAYLGSGSFSWGALSYSMIFMILLILFGTVIFNKVEKSFMDTV